MKEKIQQWFAAERWRLSLSHSLVGIPMQLIIASFTNIWVGALCVTIFYYSRKKLDYEMQVKKQGESRATTWFQGVFPWQWDKNKQLDLFFPLASSVSIALIVTLVN